MHNRSVITPLNFFWPNLVKMHTTRLKNHKGLLPSAGREISSSYGYGVKPEGLVWTIGAMVFC